ncbi:MAG: hypothetical protein CL678_16195 [Bdellovibrionaceae bacterium]|nr:hypothetical protein [Pseudobdellovibrionaceae bacterium]|tara:strand:+ start:8560 stop:8958 length:399 start_codon:yes stop_codon:yes gene_type:complete
MKTIQLIALSFFMTFIAQQGWARCAHPYILVCDSNNNCTCGRAKLKPLQTQQQGTAVLYFAIENPTRSYVSCNLYYSSTDVYGNTYNGLIRSVEVPAYKSIEENQLVRDLPSYFVLPSPTLIDSNRSRCDAI